MDSTTITSAGQLQDATKDEQASVEGATDE